MVQQAIRALTKFMTIVVARAASRQALPYRFCSFNRCRRARMIRYTTMNTKPANNAIRMGSSASRHFSHSPFPARLNPGVHVEHKIPRVLRWHGQWTPSVAPTPPTHDEFSDVAPWSQSSGHTHLMNGCCSMGFICLGTGQNPSCGLRWV